MFAYYSRWIKNFSEKIRPLSQNTKFPLQSEVKAVFEELKNDIASSTLASVNPEIPLIVETDASDYAVGATLNQSGRPVAFFSRTLSQSERKLHSVEKEAYAIVEAINTWKHYLLGQSFKLITDQKSVSFMFDNKNHGKVKNDKIARWRIELSNYKFDIVYRPGICNQAADTLSRSSCAGISNSNDELETVHNSLCHPGCTRLNHFIRSRNMP